MNEQWDQIYKMVLGQTLLFKGPALATSVLRVPGGWVFSQVDKHFNIGSSCFVPYSTEWQAP